MGQVQRQPEYFGTRVGYRRFIGPDPGLLRERRFCFICGFGCTNPKHIAAIPEPETSEDARASIEDITGYQPGERSSGDPGCEAAQCRPSPEQRPTPWYEGFTKALRRIWDSSISDFFRSTGSGR